MVNSERLEIIFAGLAAGLPIVEIDKRLDQFESRRTDKEERGASAVRNVLRALSGLPEVTSLTPTLPCSPLDLVGVDIVTKLSEQELPILIEVKSSEAGIAEFYDNVARVQRLSPDRVQDWLSQQRRMVIHGHRADDEIVENFYSQLTLIDACTHSRKKQMTIYP